MHQDLLSPSERDEIVAKHLREHLPPLGLKEVAARKWVDGSVPPVRRIFEMQLLKGAGMKACWGWSLDFVPHFSSVGRLQWHRSDKSAMLDVFMNPGFAPQPTYLYGASRLDSDLKELLPSAVFEAQKDWSRGATLEGIFTIARELYTAECQRNCFGYSMYMQRPLAFAFLSARIGDLETAQRELSLYVARHDLDTEEASKLDELAMRYAAGG